MCIHCEITCIQIKFTYKMSLIPNSKVTKNMLSKSRLFMLSNYIFYSKSE